MVSLDKVEFTTEAHWRMGIQRHEEIEWGPWIKNTICIGLGDFIGATMSKATLDSGIPGGYDPGLHIALGEGVYTGGWDFPNVAPPAGNTSTLLVAEIARKPAHVLGWRQGEPPPHVPPGTITQYPSVHYDRPIYTANWTTIEALTTHGLREIGLFGGPGAASANSGLLLNVLRYPVQHKDSVHPYTLYWEVEFRIKWS